MTAPLLLGPPCSSAYQAGQSLLVDYPLASGGSTTRILGLDSSREVIFDFAYANAGGCDTSWNSVPVSFDDLRFE